MRSGDVIIRETGLPELFVGGYSTRLLALRDCDVSRVTKPRHKAVWTEQRSRLMLPGAMCRLPCPPRLVVAPGVTTPRWDVS